MKHQKAATAAKRKKIRKAQNKLGFAGALYVLGALAMAAFACLPTLKIDGKQLWVVDFWKPIVEIFKKKVDIFAIAVAALYGILVLIAVIGFFAILGKLGGFSKRSLKYVDGFDRNMDALDATAKIFTSSFAAIISIHLLIWLLQPTGVKVEVTMYAYAMLAAGLVVHFLAGLIGGKVSYFRRERDGSFTEEPREWSLALYFFRNLVQIAAVAGICWFFVPNATIGDTVSKLIAKQNPFAGDLVKTLVPFALQVLILLCVFVLIRHAVGATEYNLDGTFGKGMKNYCVFSFFVFLLAGGLFATQLIWKVKPVVNAYAIVAGIAFVAFLFDCIFRSREKNTDEYEPEYPEQQPAPMPMPMPAPVADKECVEASKQTACPYGYPYPYPYQQPIYIPVYQPLPQAEKEETPEAAKVREEYETFDPQKRWDVECPKCGKKLMVREMAEYHRCPACDKIFCIRIKQRLNVNFND